MMEIMEHTIRFLKFIVFLIPLIDCLSIFTDFPHSGQKSVSSSISVWQNGQYSFSPSSVFEVFSLISSLGSSFSSSVSFLSVSSSCEASFSLSLFSSSPESSSFVPQFGQNALDSSSF